MFFFLKCKLTPFFKADKTFCLHRLLPLIKLPSSLKSRSRCKHKKKTVCSVEFRSSKYNAEHQSSVGMNLFLICVASGACYVCSDTERQQNKSTLFFFSNDDWAATLVTASLNIKKVMHLTRVINKVHGGFYVNQRFFIKMETFSEV